MLQGNPPSAAPKARFSLRRFIFLAALWMATGVFLGCIVAGANGVASDLWILFLMIGYVAASFLLSGSFVAIMSRNPKPILPFVRGDIAKQILDSADRGISPNGRVLARIDKFRDAGLTVSNFNRLFIFTLTVFPEYGVPYETVIHQFITMRELPYINVGRFVAFIEDPESPGYGFIDENPPEDWQKKVSEPPRTYKSWKAEKSYPDRDAGSLSGELHSPAGISRIRSAASLTANLVFFVLGFLAPITLVMGDEAVTTFVQDLPKTLAARN